MESTHATGKESGKRGPGASQRSNTDAIDGTVIVFHLRAAHRGDRRGGASERNAWRVDVTRGEWTLPCYKAYVARPT